MLFKLNRLSGLCRWLRSMISMFVDARDMITNIERAVDRTRHGIVDVGVISNPGTIFVRHSLNPVFDTPWEVF